jgi:hypothetical protein
MLCSCSDKRDFENYISDLGIDFTEPYKVDSISQFGFNDWTLEAAVQVHEKDKYRILNKIRREAIVEKVNSRELYFDNVHDSKDSLYSFIVASKYYYGMSKTRKEDLNGKMVDVGYELYEMNLDTVNNKLSFRYEYE